jgi:hydrogenase nickel incorporation protein HypB
MCSTCGCGTDQVRVTSINVVDRSTTSPPDHNHDHPHDHNHLHDHNHPHDHDHPHEHPAEHGVAEPSTHTITLEQRILAKNDDLAAHNRHWLAERGIKAVNLMSSPGAGKTSLLERTISELGQTITVIEGDQETLFDAERIRSAGARAVQVNTGAGCHLDATMVQRALDQLQPDRDGLLFVENVGNLVCPALFDLGENRRVVIISVTEGDDKPLKYPHMFAAADLVVINKIDLLPYVDFNLDKLTSQAQSLKPGVEIMALSVRDGRNLDSWYAWLEAL